MLRRSRRNNKNTPWAGRWSNPISAWPFTTMNFYWLTLAILAVWRITHLLNAEDGPWDLLFRFRELAGNGAAGKLLDCFYCLSLWVAAPFAYGLGDSWKEILLLWPALSAGSILLERLGSSRRVDTPPPAIYLENLEDSDVLLRPKENTVSGAE